MNGFKLTLPAILILSALLLGCGGLKFHRDDPPQPTIKTAPAGRGLIYKAAIISAKTPETPFGLRLNEQFLEMLIQTIGREGTRIKLVTPKEHDFPASSASPAQAGSYGDITAVMDSARRQGFQGVIQAAVRDLRVDSRTWGFLWFSRTNYFASYSVILDLYDPFTGAKLVSRLKEATVKIDFDDFESFKEGRPIEFASLEEEVIDTAGDYGGVVAKTLEKQPWKASVISVSAGLIQLAADGGAGLVPDQMVALYEARRVLQNRFGQKFNVPGFKIGEARITHTGEAVIEAALEEAADIRPGDVAVAVP
jgi:hypothetical protein